MPARRAVWFDALTLPPQVRAVNRVVCCRPQLLAGATVGLAPVYDISSILPYVGERGPDGELIAERRLRMAMKVGGESALYPPSNTWREAAADLRLDPDALVEHVRHLVEVAPSAFAAAAAGPDVHALGSEAVGRLVDEVAQRAHRCAKVLGYASAGALLTGLPPDRDVDDTDGVPELEPSIGPLSSGSFVAALVLTISVDIVHGVDAAAHICRGSGRQPGTTGTTGARTTGGRQPP